VAPIVTRAHVVRDLRRLGLRAGDVVELHSSLKSIGHVQGGPTTVIRAFQQVLGKRGTLLMPTFTYCHDGRGEAFHPDQSPSKTGLITETFRQMSDVIRSLCPVHSVAAWGRHARQFTERHPLAPTLGVGSPFHLAAQAGGKIVLLGCNHNSNSFIHVLESLAAHPVIYETTPYGSKGLLRQDDGRVKTIGLTEFTGCSKNFQALQPYLDRKGLITHGLVGQAPTQVMLGRALIRYCVPLLKRNPELLLCATCRACQLRRDFIRAHGNK
jgi:aminoglycoside 3-N-acetyltransferase